MFVQNNIPFRPTGISGLKFVFLQHPVTEKRLYRVWSNMGLFSPHSVPDLLLGVAIKLRAFYCFSAYDSVGECFDGKICIQIETASQDAIKMLVLFISLTEQLF